MNALFHRQTDVGLQETEGGFRTQVYTATDLADVDYAAVRAELNREVERFTNVGSGWTLTAILRFVVRIGQYRPLVGSSFIPTPASLMAKQALINVFNPDDNMCFAWAVLSALYPCKKNAERISKYRPHLNSIDLTGLNFPVPVNRIARFEKNNPTISINVYALGKDDREIIPKFVTKCGAREKHIDLLLLSTKTGDNFHYTWIKNMSALIFHRSKHRRVAYVCPHCVHPFTSARAFDDHFPDCSKHVYQRTIYPEPQSDESIVKWKSREKTERVPFVIYADFESCLVPVHDDSGGLDEHIPSGFCAYTVSTDPEFETEPMTYSGRDCMKAFYDHLASEQHRIAAILEDYHEMLPLTREEQERFDQTRACVACNKSFSDLNPKIMHHNHRTGKFIAALCNGCNLQIKNREDNFFVPVVFHNLKNYDAHHIFRHFSKSIAAKYDKKGRASYRSVKIIALNLERYISFEIQHLRFIDSCQFLNAKLEKLVNNLPRDSLRHTKRHMGDNELLFAKGIFPYEWFDSFGKFDCTELPPKDAFYSKLDEEDITDEEYERAQNVWTSMGCQNFKNYHDLYLTTDTLLLADVFENFRDVSMTTYRLDPAHYLTTPSLTWDACLKYTNVELELITDPEIFLFFESAMRGGISAISNRYARANNPYLEPKDYDSSQPHSYIYYLDANNLYGWAMSQCLPVGGFRFLPEEEISKIDFANVPDDSETGFVVECDLEYPSELHETHNDYPLAPDHVMVTEAMLSPFCKSMNVKHAFTEKLIGDLHPKIKYKTHYRNLKLYLSLGMKLLRVHRVVAFRQEPWLKPYVELNTKMRQQAKTDFEKDFFKLMVNAFFGKSMENVRKRRKVDLVSDAVKLKKLLAKQQLQQFVIVNEEVVMVERIRAKVTLNKPIYIGFTVLDVSKLLMFDFHYNVIAKRYGKNARLLFTDTDSLCYYFATDDVYRDMLEYRHLLDTSNYPRDHPLYSAENMKVIGKMKDECGGKPPLEFVGLRSKMYSLLTYDKKLSKRTAKGVKNRYLVKNVMHDAYLRTLRNRTIIHAKYRLFRSRAHRLQTVECRKVALCAYDDKRYVLEDGINTAAYGHYLLCK
jgi:hypothetical protein